MNRYAHTTGMIEVVMWDGRRASVTIAVGDTAQVIGENVLVAIEATPPNLGRPVGSFVGPEHALGCNMNPATHGLGGLTCTCGVAPLAGR